MSLQNDITKGRYLGLETYLKNVTGEIHGYVSSEGNEQSNLLGLRILMTQLITQYGTEHEEFLSLVKRHTSKAGPHSNSDLDSHPKKIRTREKPGLVLGLAFKKPRLDNRKLGLQIENTGFDETGF